MSLDGNGNLGGDNPLAIRFVWICKMSFFLVHFGLTSSKFLLQYQVL